MVITNLLEIQIDTKLKREAESKTNLENEKSEKIWQDLTPLMKNPVRLDKHQKFTREELHDRKGIAYKMNLTQNGPRDDPDSYLNNPLHTGDEFKIFSKEELHGR
jgi:hypothetical protein